MTRAILFLTLLALPSAASAAGLGDEREEPPPLAVPNAPSQDCSPCLYGCFNTSDGPHCSPPPGKPGGGKPQVVIIKHRPPSSEVGPEWAAPARDHDCSPCLYGCIEDPYTGYVECLGPLPLSGPLVPAGACGEVVEVEADGDLVGTFCLPGEAELFEATLAALGDDAPTWCEADGSGELGACRPGT